MSIPKTQKEYLELSHFERAKVPSEVLIAFLTDEDAPADDEDGEELYYPLNEAFEAMSEAQRAKLTKEEKLNIFNETPQKKEKK